MAEQAQPLDVNTLNNVHVVEELMGKSSSTPAGPKILCGTFLSNTLKAFASVFNSVLCLCAIKKPKENEQLVECKFHCTR